MHKMYLSNDLPHMIALEPARSYMQLMQFGTDEGWYLLPSMKMKITGFLAATAAAQVLCQPCLEMPSTNISWGTVFSLLRFIAHRPGISATILAKAGFRSQMPRFIPTINSLCVHLARSIDYSPIGWVQLKDEESGHPYYYCQVRASALWCYAPKVTPSPSLEI